MPFEKKPKRQFGDGSASRDTRPPWARRTSNTIEKDPPALESFRDIWARLMTTPVHLDSALSKLTPKQKTVLAQIMPRILAQPLALAEHYGIGVPEGEPWSLPPEKLKAWRPAALLAERMMKDLDRGITIAEPNELDFPPRILEEWKREWGDAVAKNLASGLVQPPPLSLRITRKITAEAALKELKKDSQLPVKASVSTASPVGVRLEAYTPIMRTRLYEEGLMEIQDEGSQLMALFTLAPEVYAPFLTKEPGEAPITKKFPELPSPRMLTVVDACSGAGGKALAIADLLSGKGRVYGYDVFESKVAALKKRAKRAGLNNVQGVLIPEHQEEEALLKHHGSADIVLVDSPCSGWGVLKRNPDIKWRGLSDSLDKLPALQLRLLTVYSKLVKPKGSLIFGVCTMRKTETTDIVAAFLKTHPDFEATVGGYYGPGRTDGFYMQAFRKRT